MGLYGCTQKSVAVGIPMISTLYEHDPRAGLYTLPLLIWHPLQLLIGSALAPHLAAGVERLERHVSNGASDSQRRSFFANASIRESIRHGASVAFATPSQMSWPMTGDGAAANEEDVPVLAENYWHRVGLGQAK